MTIQSVQQQCIQRRYNMPAMPRLDGKTTKIAYKILGIPANLRKVKKSKKEEFQERKLIQEETYRVR